MNNDEVRKWLDEQWLHILNDSDREVDPEIDALVNSGIVSIRYAVVTQLLGKIADPARSLFAIQLEAGGEGAWDARSFSTAVVVPWVGDNHQVIGTSAEPYVSKPLRRGRLSENMKDVQKPDEWNRLVRFFEGLEGASDQDLQNVFKLVLKSLAARLDEQNITYPIPRRISLAQMEVSLMAS